MKTTVSDLREQYGSVYITELPDGQLIPWNPLSLKDFINYTNDFQRGFVTTQTLENEIFCKCAVDEFTVKNINKQKAGTISTVVGHILQESGISTDSLLLLNNHLNQARIEFQNNPYHEMINLICVAFPAYKPEDVYSLKFETFKLRFVQAEYHLLKIGYITEPLSIINKDENSESQPNFPKKEPIDLKAAFEANELQKQKERKIPKNKQIIKEDIAPTQRNKIKNGKLIITKEEMSAKTAIGDMDEAPFMEHQMLEDAAVIYRNYLEDAKAGKEVIIKTPEQRLQEKKMKDKARPSKLKQTAGR